MIPRDAPHGALALRAIARDEARYVLEWVAFHLLAGVQQIRVYDNESVDGTGLLLAGLADHYPVEVVYWPSIEGHSPRTTDLMDGYAALRDRFGFVAHIDLDEFLFAQSGRSLAAWLAAIADDVAAVGVNQLVFGASGERGFRPDLVIARFQRHMAIDAAEHGFVRSIVRPERVLRPRARLAALNGGRFVHIDDSDLVDTGAPPGRAPRIVLGDVRLHHYTLKSAEEIAAKSLRGGVSAATRALRQRRYAPGYFSALDARANAEADDTLHPRFAPVRELVAEMAGRIAPRVGR